MENKEWLKGTVKTNDGHIHVIRYTDEGRWMYEGFNIRIPQPCNKHHKNIVPAALFAEDGSMFRIWFCSCGTWKELNVCRTGDLCVWNKTFYK